MYVKYGENENLNLEKYLGISSADDDLIYSLYGSTVKLMILLLMFGEIWFIFTQASSMDEIAASINTTLIQFLTLYRYKNMVLHKNIYTKLAMSMESPYFDTNTNYRKHLVHYWAQKNESYLKLVLFLGNCTLAAWFLYPLIDGLEYNMFIGIRLPFYYRSPYRYAIVYLLVAMAFVYVAHFVMVNDLIMQAHLLHMVCQFAVLRDCLKNILRDCDRDLKGLPNIDTIRNVTFQEKYMTRLKVLVRQHRIIVSLVMELRRTLSGPMLCQLVASGVIICFTGYQITATGAKNVTKLLMSLFYLGYNLFEFYIICRWCEEITIQSQKVGEAVYCSNWESGVSNYSGVKSTLVLVIARANKPLVFSAGGMYKLSLLSYSTSFHSSGGPIKDLSIDVADLRTLTDELKSASGFGLDKFRDTGYYRNGCVGKYLSKNLRDYIYNGLGEPSDEALILTVHFTNKTAGSVEEDGSLSFLVHNSKVDDADSSVVKSYIDSLRHKRSIIDMLRPLH